MKFISLILELASEGFSEIWVQNTGGPSYPRIQYPRPEKNLEH